MKNKNADKISEHNVEYSGKSNGEKSKRKRIESVHRPRQHLLYIIRAALGQANPDDLHQKFYDDLDKYRNDDSKDVEIIFAFLQFPSVIIEDAMLQNSKFHHLNIAGPSNRFNLFRNTQTKTALSTILIDNQANRQRRPHYTPKKKTQNHNNASNNSKYRGFYCNLCSSHFKSYLLRHFRRQHKAICTEIEKKQKYRKKY